MFVLIIASRQKQLFASVHMTALIVILLVNMLLCVCSKAIEQQYHHWVSPLQTSLELGLCAAADDVEHCFSFTSRSLNDHIVKCRNAIFGHISRMPSNVPVHQALSCQVDLSLGRPPDCSWKRRPGRPPKRWLDQMRDDSQRPPADVWRNAVRRGHRGATQRSSATTR